MRPSNIPFHTTHYLLQTQGKLAPISQRFEGGYHQALKAGRRLRDRLLQKVDVVQVQEAGLLQRFSLVGSYGVGRVASFERVA